MSHHNFYLNQHPSALPPFPAFHPFPHYTSTFYGKKRISSTADVLTAGWPFPVFNISSVSTVAFLNPCTAQSLHRCAPNASAGIAKQKTIC